MDVDASAHTEVTKDKDAEASAHPKVSEGVTEYHEVKVSGDID